MNMRAGTRKNIPLGERISALRTRHADLDAKLAEEARRPLPCQVEAGRLKRAKLRLKDEIASLEGVMRALG